MGRDSRSEGCGFESRHHMLDGHFFTHICWKNCNVCLKRSKINKKRPGLAHLKKVSKVGIKVLRAIGTLCPIVVFLQDCLSVGKWL